MNQNILLRTVKALTLVIIGSFALNCQNENQSTATGSSHYAGTNCGNCHSSGENMFTISGTVYTDRTGTTVAGSQGINVEITDSGGNMLSIPVDTTGNFYTNASVSFPATAAVSTGTPMVQEVTSSGGSCGSCHGVGTQAVIYK